EQRRKCADDNNWRVKQEFHSYRQENRCSELLASTHFWQSAQSAVENSERTKHASARRIGSQDEVGFFRKANELFEGQCVIWTRSSDERGHDRPATQHAEHSYEISPIHTGFGHAGCIGRYARSNVRVVRFRLFPSVFIKVSPWLNCIGPESELGCRRHPRDEAVVQFLGGIVPGRLELGLEGGHFD